MLRLKSCGLGEGGGRVLLRHCVSTPRSRRSAFARMRAVDGRYQRQSNTTLTSLDLHENGLEEGGGQALAEAPRVNTTLTSLHLNLDEITENGGNLEH